MKMHKDLTPARLLVLAQIAAGLALISFALRGLGTPGCLVAIGGLVAGHAFAMLPAPVAAPAPAPVPPPAAKPAAPAARTRPPRPARRPAALTR